LRWNMLANLIGMSSVLLPCGIFYGHFV
jgi:hypothetical protein